LLCVDNVLPMCWMMPTLHLGCQAAARELAPQLVAIPAVATHVFLARPLRLPPCQVAISLSLSLSLSVCARAHTHKHTHTHTHTHTHYVDTHTHTHPHTGPVVAQVLVHGLSAHVWCCARQDEGPSPSPPARGSHSQKSSIIVDL
jgi:hypothetical protein